MLWIAAVSALAAAPPAERPTVQRQARATVRIVRAATVRQDHPRGTDAEGAIVRESRTRTADAPPRAVKLVEFY
jgi:hypothetical protein